jgi:hypothetical protein
MIEEYINGDTPEIIRRHIPELGIEYYLPYDIDSSQFAFLPIVFKQDNKFDLRAKVIDDNVEVTLSGHFVLTVETGPLGPIPSSIMSFWVYENHWAIEILKNPRTDSLDEIYEEIFVDGKSLIGQFGNQRTFNLSIIQGKLFYFYERNNQLGFSYDGVDYPLDYDEISYAYCCGIMEVNPHRFENAIYFVATRNNEIYYVLLGLINSK